MDPRIRTPARNTRTAHADDAPRRAVTVRIAHVGEQMSEKRSQCTVEAKRARREQEKV